MSSTASRSKGNGSHPCAKFVRFTEKENERLNRLCRKRSLTVQTFIHAATMRALNEAELGNKTDAERLYDGDSGDEAHAAGYRPTGLGIGFRERIRTDHPQEENDDNEAESTPSPPLPPAISTPATADSDMVLALARTVVESPQSARRETLQAACRAIARGRTQEAAVQLAEDLDAAIKRLEGAPKTYLERARARMK